MNLKHKESQYSSSSRSPAGMEHRSNPTSQKQQMPLVVTLNCIEDTSFEQDCLGGVVLVEHVPLSRLADARIESASAVLIHSLAFLPRAAQRRLRPWQLILCLGSSDRSVDSALAADLGLTQLVHVDCSRAEEIADTVMALILGLLRRTHLLSTHALSASGWLGSVQPLCRGMRRCRGLVLGIIGRSASARSLATRSLAFKMSVLYFDVQEGNGEGSQTSIRFPPAARRMDTLNDLLAASDVISLHCALTNETVQIINADCLQHIKPGAFLVNTGSCQLLDDCAVKQLLIDGTLAGCALDGAEGPQWMEAWIKEMPNVLILPRSADYSEEVWMEIREKAISMLQAFFLDGVIPKDAISGDEEESEVAYGNEECNTQGSLSVLQGHGGEGYNEDANLTAESSRKKVTSDSKGTPTQPQGSVLSQNISERSEVKRSRSGKKAKKRHARQKSQQKVDDHIKFEKESTSQNEDGTTLSGTDQVLSSSPRFSSPEGARSRKTPNEFIQESSSEKPLKSNTNISRKSGELLRDGYIIALHTRHHPALHVSRQRVKGGGWFLDTMSNITKRDPAAQFLVAFRSKDTIGLRSFTAGGKLLQSYLDTYTKYDVDSKLIKQKESLKEPFGDAFMSHNSRLYHVFYPPIHVTMHKINRRMEFVFASHSFDVWESWTFEGSLEECRLVNCRNPSAILDVRIEILAAIGEDGITRWLD